jgi:hypothetical protein
MASWGPPPPPKKEGGPDADKAATDYVAKAKNWEQRVKSEKEAAEVSAYIIGVVSPSKQALFTQ